jgi:hypothetical protein
MNSVFVSLMGSGSARVGGEVELHYLAVDPTFLHQFTIGSEVRTLVPEPGTGALVWMGLGLLGSLGGTRFPAR